MSKEIARRDFLKAAAAGAAGLVAAGTLGGVTAFAEEEKETGLPFEGKKKFAGIGSCRMVTDDIVYIGVSDRRIQLFENVYPIPRGVAYNSYVILDEKTVLVDTVDRSVTGQFFENLTAVLDGRDLDYLIVNHMEPDHSSAISEVLVRYPNAKVVCTLTASLILNQFFACDISDRSILVGEGDTLNVGKHTPMTRFPERCSLRMRSAASVRSTAISLPTRWTSRKTGCRMPAAITAILSVSTASRSRMSWQKPVRWISRSCVPHTVRFGERTWAGSSKSTACGAATHRKKKRSWWSTARFTAEQRARPTPLRRRSPRTELPMWRSMTCRRPMSVS